MVAQSKIIQVGSIPVYFPFNPYPDQEKYISTVISALNARENALLESPTGTGKTLCLLTSTLAWLAYQRKLENERGATKKSPIKIVYTSRTHSQLKQVVSELKSTPYRPVVSVVGSRDQTCVNSELAGYKGRLKNLKCTELTSKNKCVYYENDRTKHRNWKNRIVKEHRVLDIEELASEGRQNNTCPFFTMKILNDEADLLVMPYNYLTDKAIRDNYANRLQNSILIFDEAHNIESAAEEGASVTLTTSDFQAAVHELDQILKFKEEFPITSIGGPGSSTKESRRLD